MRLTGTNRENMGSSMWAPVMEKAWAKVKGSFQIAEGGMTSNGIRAIMGIPVLRYGIQDAPSYQTIFDQLTLAD